MASLQQNAAKDGELLTHLGEQTRNIDKRLFDFQDSVSKLKLTFPPDLDLHQVCSYNCLFFADLTVI